MLLAFDTATPQVSVALHDGTSVVAEEASDRAMKHGEQLAPLISAVLAAAGVTPAELARVGVGVGPGPFTGLRVGLVTARTLGFALDIPVDGVCSLDVLALEAVSTGAVNGPFQVATDARRKEVYFATYGPSADRFTGPVVDHPATLHSHVVTVGEGAALYPEAFPEAVGPQRPSAGWLARGLVEGRFEVAPPEPLYLRRPDAEK
ncbi:tRNA (adenosine(37)-N6)-threonylcarbamoyltransferase complex dimerization subunit type 1 TsaB [Nocardioides sp. Kera G14]|uniref:tRNA (adenosine(37)-N6)-threonylcarbamoyltransferase complex dimerization subunit type 1 TsaB n=1 Tax=Nocardioides sp. Kera G14 TaxID=2884264 RepID=UPI001D0FF2F9|nr:tRNA (adenosine(37)-N6)-threonylcarbamoyltransferase complex dimerization subunit type 1 TsaB [Nocardioides sp. Kera G14]UDY24313.1 tRNA (adenosine(37)-N6)-threonylcarbamoyltransferase complex dimerization subunit type 1 TsaB [Nocardioides sp. Kera G14]